MKACCMKLNEYESDTVTCPPIRRTKRFLCSHPSWEKLIAIKCFNWSGKRSCGLQHRPETEAFLWYNKSITRWFGLVALPPNGKHLTDCSAGCVDMNFFEQMILIIFEQPAENCVTRNTMWPLAINYLVVLAVAENHTLSLFKMLVRMQIRRPTVYGRPVGSWNFWLDHGTFK